MNQILTNLLVSVFTVSVWMLCALFIMMREKKVGVISLNPQLIQG